MDTTYTTHFTSQTIITEADDVSGELVIHERVKQNQVIISLSPETSPDTAILVAGENCCLSDDNQKLTALLAGYPEVTTRIDNGRIIIEASLNPLITLSKDNMLALMNLYPPVQSQSALTLDELRGYIEEQNICYGIDEALLAETLQTVLLKSRPSKNVPVARGMLPINGNDAFLRFEVEIGPLPGKILQDGSMDWRERKIFIGIEKDEIIATKVPLTEGTPGVNIFRQLIPQTPGKDITVKVAGDVEYREESGQVVASRSGVLSIVNETDVKVSAKQTINGDVDFSVGNIESKDGLEIRGNVKPGFIVRCRGDLLIGGNVESATIRCIGNTKLTGGIIGENAVLSTEGDIEIAFIERGKLTAGGTVVIRKGAYYATVSSQKKILCKPDVKIIGGYFSCGSDFIGRDIGSGNAAPASIAAGINPGRLEQRRKFKKEIVTLENELVSLLAIHGEEYAGSDDYQEKRSHLNKLRKNLRKFNLIEGSPNYSRHDAAFMHSSATITVYGKIAAGTRLRIGNAKTTLEEDASAIRFYIDRPTGKIIIRPFTEKER
ncbi:DUF342 domain-containing protein [Desulfosediminicola flagellatus]|uniref:DUF342 domain-containing protein n=1 Tax=Desulfosediminicola flagellatus TaxID=2569541 RepID=UPI0010AC7BBE|nr:FapA family protein [Desulfosediminicola flagellatus]